MYIYRNFDKDTVEISVRRLTTEGDKIVLHIESDYSHSAHKGRLHVNEKDLAETVERFWKSIKTKKLQKLSVWFGEIDWYDNMTDIYDTPIMHFERGWKRTRVSHRDHGSIPKDWSFNMGLTFADTATNTPLIEALKAALDCLFTKEIEKEFVKALRPFLRKEKSRMDYRIPVEDKPYVAPRWY